MGRAATANRPRKRRRSAACTAAYEGPDCFSNLPDDVLLAIASRLPTRLAVSLSVLARSFRHLPTLFDHVDSVSLCEPAFQIPLRTSPRLLLRRLALSPAPAPCRAGPFLDAGTGLACLTLRGLATMLLSAEYEEIPKLAITFRDLRILSVSLDFSSESELVFLMKLLECCPSLQQLTISAAETIKENVPQSFADHKERLTKLSCLTESLVQFKFLGFRPQQYQKKLIILLLTQAKKLKKMGVEFPKSEQAAVREILFVRLNDRGLWII